MRIKIKNQRRSESTNRNYRKWVLLLYIVPVFSLISCAEFLNILFEAVQADTQFPIEMCEEVEPKVKTATLNLRVFEGVEPVAGARFHAHVRFKEMRPLEIDGEMICARLHTAETTVFAITDANGNATVVSPAYTMKHEKSTIEFFYTMSNAGQFVKDRGYIEFGYDDSSEKTRSWDFKSL